MTYINTEEMRRAAQTADAAADSMRRSAGEVEEAVRRLEQQLADGYGGNALRLIELLENLEIPGPVLASPQVTDEQIDYPAGYKALAEFIEEFEIDSGEGIYRPNEQERFAIEQFVLELMSNDDAKEFINVEFVKHLRAPPAEAIQETKTVAADLEYKIKIRISETDITKIGGPYIPGNDAHELDKLARDIVALLALSAPPAADAKDSLDAGRYRWLRDHAAYVGINSHAKTSLWILRGIYEVPGAGLCEAIDAAIAAKGAAK